MADANTPGPLLRDQLNVRIADLIEAGADRFAPARFRFIQALADKAQRQRPSVAALLEERAMRLLSEYFDDCRAVGVAATDQDKPGPAQPSVAKGASRLAALTEELTRRVEGDAPVADQTLEEQFRRQEQQLLQSLGMHGRAGAGAAHAGTNHGVQAGSVRRSGAADRLHQSLQLHHRQQRVIRALEDGPDAPGPLNAQALVVQSLAMMRDLSPQYTVRFASFMDAMFWLEDAARVTGRKPAKRGGRRKK